LGFRFGPSPGLRLERRDTAWPGLGFGVLGVVVLVAVHTLPELEGFRRRGDGAFSLPLTSLQRWLAEHEAWRLHVVASDSCTVSAVLGAMPRQVTVRARHATAGTWQVAII